MTRLCLCLWFMFAGVDCADRTLGDSIRQTRNDNCWKANGADWVRAQLMYLNQGTHLAVDIRAGKDPVTGVTGYRAALFYEPVTQELHDAATATGASPDDQEAWDRAFNLLGKASQILFSPLKYDTPFEVYAVYWGKTDYDTNPDSRIAYLKKRTGEMTPAGQYPSVTSGRQLITGAMLKAVIQDLPPERQAAEVADPQNPGGTTTVVVANLSITSSRIANGTPVMPYTPDELTRCVRPDESLAEEVIAYVQTLPNATGRFFADVVTFRGSATSS